MERLFFDEWSVLLRTGLIGVLAYVGLILLLRCSGKRTLSKMNAFDFVVTVALGSTLASILVSKDVALAQETNIIRYLEQAALAGRAQEFTTLLQQGLGVSRALSRRIVTDPAGEPFVARPDASVRPPTGSSGRASGRGPSWR